MSISQDDYPLAEYVYGDLPLAKAIDRHAKTNAAMLPDGAVLAPNSFGGKRTPYQATQPKQELTSKRHLVVVPVTKPLLVQCDDCRGYGQLTHDHPNDPYAKVFTCSMCDGTGEVIPECNGWKCREDATEWVDGATWCPAHAAEQKADALIGAAP